MNAAVKNLGPDTIPIRNGWRVVRDDGSSRTVLQRPSGDGWAVFSGESTDALRVPSLGYAGSWRQDLAEALDWARTEFPA